MTLLSEMQFELLDYEDALADGYVFGFGKDVATNGDGFDPGDHEWVTQDGVNPTRGATLFGRDMPIANSWSWSAHTETDDVESALAAIGDCARVWRGRAYSSTPGAVTTLRYRIGGRVRRIYGRPRRFKAPPSNLILTGLVPINMDFKRADHLHYEDELSSVIIPLAVEGDGGFILPTTMPIHTSPISERNGTAVVLGDSETYPVIRFNGPVINPSLSTDDWTLSLNVSLADGESYEVDTRPWHLTVKRNGVLTTGGGLGRRQRLADMFLTPGSHSFQFAGSGSGVNSLCTVSWRSAWTSL